MNSAAAECIRGSNFAGVCFSIVEVLRRLS